MEAIYLLIPIALILVAIGIAIFFWAVKSDQFEDLEGPAHSILFDDDAPSSKKSSSKPEIKSDPASDKESRPDA